MEEWIACDSPPLSRETRFSDIERRGGYVFMCLAVAPSDAFTTDFSFLNLVEHKAEEILRFFGNREQKGRCHSLAGKRRLNRVFEAMCLCYADRSGPSTSLLANDAAPPWLWSWGPRVMRQSTKDDGRTWDEHRCNGVP